VTFFLCRLEASAGFEGVPFATVLAILIYGMTAGAPSRAEIGAPGKAAAYAG